MEGIEHKTIKNRQLTMSQDMEHDSKSKQAILSHNGVEEDNADSDSDDNDLDELNGYNRSESDTELDRTTNVDDNVPVQVVEVTNKISA